MTFLPNSLSARDIASIVHPQTHLRAHLDRGPDMITRGRGVSIIDEDGKEYIDGAAGLWCASLGFASERLAQVAYDQMVKLGYYHLYRHNSNEPSVMLAEELLRLAPVPMARVLFQCSGSEANDAAVKLAWYYHHAIGKPEKIKIIGRLRGYHGSTAAAISVSGKPDMHADFGLPFAMFRHTEFPHYYTQHLDGESEEEFATRMADALEQLILAEGPETVAAFFAEPVMGAGGGIVPPATYFEKIQAVLRKYEVLFVADEVICGFGRTGNMWGSQTFDLQPDMISCAKALSAAMQPISALLINDKVYQAMLSESDKLGGFGHGSTYAGHPVAAAVALETLKIYDEIDVVGRARRIGQVMHGRLRALEAHPLVGNYNGVGLVGGLELVADKATRAPFAASEQVGTRVGDAARERGLIARIVGDRAVFSPPLVISEEEVHQLADRLTGALDEVAGELGR
jgi:4-aminobutyrate---pyruvate transaminase